MKLFDESNRTYMDYKDEDESHYAFLNRTARPEFASARDVLETWFVAYPHDHQAILASNFKSDRYGSHLGAFFELYCFTLLRALGFEVHIEEIVDAEKGNPIDFVVGSIQSPKKAIPSTLL